MIDKQAGLPGQIRALEHRLKEMDASKVKPAMLKEITDTINNLKALLKEKLEKKEQRKKDKEQKNQEVEKEAISVPNAADVGAVSQNSTTTTTTPTTPAGTPGAPASTSDDQKVSCPLCGGLTFNDNASYQQHMAYTHASDILPTTPGQKQDKLVATIEPEEAALNKKIHFKLDQIVKPVRGSESKGRIMRHDGPDDLAFVMWEEGALKDRDGFGGYYPSDLSLVEEEPVEATIETPKEEQYCPCWEDQSAYCPKCKSKKTSDLRSNYDALLKDLKEEYKLHYEQGNFSWTNRLQQKIDDLQKAIQEKFGVENA